MNSTTGAEATALSIAERTSVERKDFCRAAKRGERRGLRRGRRVWEATCGGHCQRAHWSGHYRVRRTEKAERENMLAAFMMCDVVVFRRVVGMSRICFLRLGASKVRRSWSDAKMLTTRKHE